MKKFFVLRCGIVLLMVQLISSWHAASFAADAASPAASISGFRYEFPCATPMPENPTVGADCISGLVKGDPNTTDNFTAQKTFGGEKGKRYKVTLRFRGVVEPMMYKDGKQVGDYFYIGGEKNNATYNVYQLSVSSPASHYFLNRQDKVGHEIFTIDYTQTIEIDGGATVTFHGNGQNGRLISNFKKLVVEGVAPAPKPYNGQFIQVDVVEVSLATAAAEEPAPIRALLVLGGCCHDYKEQQTLLAKGISARANVQWAISYDPDTGTKHLNPQYEKAEWAKGFDVVVHDECCSDVTDPKIVEKILQPHRDGLPAVILHCGMHSYRTADFPKSTPWFDFTGVASTGHGPQAPIEVSYVAKENPITAVLKNWKTENEELYNNSAGKLLDTAQPLASGVQTWKAKDGKEESATAICVWTNIYNKKTKVFSTTLGHNNVTVGDDRYLDLVTRGLLWSVGKLDDAHLKPAKKVMLDDK